MIYANLISGKLIQRYKRFLADIELSTGDVITAHCPNSGSMMGVKTPGSKVWVSRADPKKKRRLRYTWELIEENTSLISIHTSKANDLVEEALKKNLIQPLSMYTHYKREVAYGHGSRVDFLLSDDNLPPYYLEVKSVHLKQEGSAAFPDAVTERGHKHLKALMAEIEKGHRAGILYVIQRDDCSTFSYAHEIDPMYADLSKDAQKKGVDIFCYACKVSLSEITISHPVPIIS